MAALYTAAGGLEARGKAVDFFSNVTRRIDPRRIAELLQQPDGQARYLWEIKDLLEGKPAAMRPGGPGPPAWNRMPESARADASKFQEIDAQPGVKTE